MRTLSVSLAALLLLAGTANATTPIGGSTTITSSGTSGVVAVADLLPTFSFNPQRRELNNVERFVSLTHESGERDEHLRFHVTDTFTFTLPGTGTTGDLRNRHVSVSKGALIPATVVVSPGPTGPPARIFPSPGDMW